MINPFLIIMRSLLFLMVFCSAMTEDLSYCFKIPALQHVFFCSLMSITYEDDSMAI